MTTARFANPSTTREKSALCFFSRDFLLFEPQKSCKMSMATSYRYEVERPGAKNLRKALKRQEERIKVGFPIVF